MNHFHVRWDNSKVDWEAFTTKEEAKVQGERLKRPGETYVIEERDGDCQLCKRLKSSALVLAKFDLASLKELQSDGRQH
jgi:hypothetical protein